VVNKESVNQLSLLLFCLVQMKFVDNQKYKQINQIVFDNMELLNN